MNVVKIVFFTLCIVVVQISFAQQTDDFFDLIRNNQIIKVKKAIQKDSTIINKPDPKGFTPLILASYYNRLDIALTLLKNGADVNSYSDMGTALMAATYKGDLEMVKLLLNYKTDVNKTDNNLKTALHLACIFNYNNIAKQLIKHYAKTNVKDANNKTPIDYCILNNNIELIKLFEYEQNY
jgi:ankyrin repeat protein